MKLLSTSKQRVSLVFASALALIGAPEASAQNPTPVRLAYVTQPAHSFGIGARAFTKKLSELAGVRFAVKEFPAGALGGEQQNIEQLQIGALEVSVTTTGVLANFVPEIGILDIPFLFRDPAHAHAVLDSKIGDELLAKLGKIGILGLAWGESGFRQLSNNVRPIRTPKDLQGIKLRTMQVQEHVTAFSALGAKPTVIAFPEVYTALQQGTADGAEGPTQTMLTSKFYEVQKYLSITNHLYAASAILVSKRFFDGLPAKDQAAFRTAARQAAEAQREAVYKGENKQLDELRAKGVRVETQVDIKAFEDALKPAYTQFARKFGAENIARIKNFKR